METYYSELYIQQKFRMTVAEFATELNFLKSVHLNFDGRIITDVIIGRGGVSIKSPGVLSNYPGLNY